MMETLIKINGRTIWHFKIRNTGEMKENLHKYNVTAFNVENENIKKFAIYHDRDDGATDLVSKVTEELNSD